VHSTNTNTLETPYLGN